MSDFEIKHGTLVKYTGNGGDVIIPDGVKKIGKGAFENCSSLTSITIPSSVAIIGDRAFFWCDSLTSITIPSSVTSIGDEAFSWCPSLMSITIPDGVKKIGESAFHRCTALTSITFSASVTSIGESAFGSCSSLTSVTIPDGVKKIGRGAFFYCENLISVIIPANVTSIENVAFGGCPHLTVICSENSVAHRYCVNEHISFLFDYQYASFHGTIPSGLEMLASPFLADEEKPYIFISYSHKDRDSVLPILKTLYEAGWKVWYDEGLTIGDSYDLVLENHVKNCSAFLLFVTSNSLVSHYIEEHEIPWAKQYEKPIIKCILEEGTDYEINDAKIVDTVKPGNIEPALEKVDGLAKGEKREAKGITIAVDPAARDDHASGDGFAYCLYAKESKADAKTILHDIKDGGAVVYDADEEGEDEKKLGDSSCLIVFLDQAFFSDPHLKKILTDAYRSGKDIAVCLLDNDIILPAELDGLDKMQCLNYVDKVPGDLNKKLLRHLEKRGCRNTSVIPGFEYEKTKDGIVITRYTGHDPCPRLEREYGGVPVVKIGDHAFENLNFITEFVIPEGVREIGGRVFSGCTSLTKVTIPKGVTSIENWVFYKCSNLTSITIPSSVKSIGRDAFHGCSSLTSIKIPEGVKRLGESAFFGCSSLTSITIPSSVKSIEYGAFSGCSSLTSITIPSSLMSIGERAFSCCGLWSITIPSSVRSIGKRAFSNCRNLMSITFQGTKEEWKAIKKGKDWDKRTGFCIVHCANGDLKNSNLKKRSLFKWFKK